MHKIDWYFDFISPYSYLASESLARLSPGIEWAPQPILFAGLLGHWGTRGPAEIAPMRRFTFRLVRYLADRDGITLRMPPRHPFNPLKLLRLCFALQAELVVVQRLFRFVWAEGGNSDDPDDWRRLTAELGVDDADRLIEAPEVKTGLRRLTEQAINRGVFGVPSFVVDEQVFWGYDSLEFLQAYLADPGLLASPGMLAADAMPEGIGRKPANEEQR